MDVHTGPGFMSMPDCCISRWLFIPVVTLYSAAIIQQEAHSSLDLDPMPCGTYRFEPLGGPYHLFDQINHPICKEPFAAAGIQGFMPIQPFLVPSDPDLIAAIVSSSNQLLSLLRPYLLKCMTNDTLFTLPSMIQPNFVHPAFDTGGSCLTFIAHTDNSHTVMPSINASSSPVVS